ncbi:hypothetical protein ABCS02_10680 [Microbacterium sp. X-17]|uniref:hypothetical protein n=1 Tax=Microbacterium sp. X-17 TaxID=3144404 RepID=UPI0031F5D1F6
MDITGGDVAAALRGQRAMSKKTVSAAVTEAARLCGTSPRTLHRRLGSGTGLTLDEVSALATVLGVKASHIYRLAQLHHESRTKARAS